MNHSKDTPCAKNESDESLKNDQMLAWPHTAHTADCTAYKNKSKSFKR